MTPTTMRNRTRNVLTLAIVAMAALVLTTTTANAAIIAATDFNDTVKSAASQTMTGVDWTGDANVTPSTSITTAAAENFGYWTGSVNAANATRFAPNQELIGGKFPPVPPHGPWAATIDLVFNAGFEGTLSSIVFDYQHLQDNGNNQGANKPVDFDITVNGSTYGGTYDATSSSGTATFTGVALLNTGSNTIVLTTSVPSKYHNRGMAIDDLVFNGTVAVVPEPATMSLLALGGLALLRRRRRS